MSSGIGGNFFFIPELVEILATKQNKYLKFPIPTKRSSQEK